MHALRKVSFFVQTSIKQHMASFESGGADLHKVSGATFCECAGESEIQKGLAA